MSKEFIMTALIRKNYKSVFKNSVLLSKGGSGIAYKKDDKIIKKQLLYNQQPKQNKDFFDKSPTCIFIKESFLLEALVMQILSKFSILIPKLYDVFLFKEDGKWYSAIVMDQQIGIPYSTFRTSVTEKQLCMSWYNFLQDMQILFNNFRFLHGDLIQDNMIVEYNRIKLIDFGLSFIMVHGILFLRYHIVPRLLKINNDSKKMKMSQIAGIDICKLLYRHGHFSKQFEIVLDSCKGEYGHRNKDKAFYPNPIYMNSSCLTFDVALSELSKYIKTL
jgi:tRNA A-37 threonylcarbamoyl transferase component Bud32